MCANQLHITSLEQGYIPGFPDDGNAVQVRLSNNLVIPANFRYNANDDAGKSLISLLRLAFQDNLKVTLVDHYGYNCDDFDNVIVEK